MKILILGNGFDMSLGIGNLSRDEINDSFFPIENAEKEKNNFLMYQVLHDDEINELIIQFKKNNFHKNEKFRSIFMKQFNKIGLEFKFNFTNLGEKIGLEEFIRPLEEFLRLKIRNSKKIINKIVKLYVIKKIFTLFPENHIKKMNEFDLTKIKKKLETYESIFTFNYSTYAEEIINDSNSNRIFHLHGIIGDKNSPPIIGGLDDKKDQNIISDALKEILFLKINKPRILEIDIFGFSFDQDEDVLNDLQKLKEKNDIGNVIIRYYFFFKPFMNERLIELNEEFKILYENICDNYSVVQKIKEKKQIQYNLNSNMPFLFNRCVIRGKFNRYWLSDSPINQSNFDNNWLDNFFDEETQIAFFIVGSLLIFV